MVVAVADKSGDVLELHLPRMENLLFLARSPPLDGWLRWPVHPTRDQQTAKQRNKALLVVIMETPGVMPKVRNHRAAACDAPW
jgi:hypothetical protein